MANMPTVTSQAPEILAFAISVVLGVILLLYFGQLGGKPSHFQVQRVFKIALYLERQIESALQEGTLDMFGNLNVVARNIKFLTYKGFLEEDVKSIAGIMAKRKGFQSGYVDFGPKITTFRFKLKS
mgnify:CR=1 FL=1